MLAEHEKRITSNRKSLRRQRPVKSLAEKSRENEDNDAANSVLKTDWLTKFKVYK